MLVMVAVVVVVVAAAAGCGVMVFGDVDMYTRMWLLVDLLSWPISKPTYTYKDDDDTRAFHRCLGTVGKA